MLHFYVLIQVSVRKFPTTDHGAGTRWIGETWSGSLTPQGNIQESVIRSKLPAGEVGGEAIAAHFRVCWVLQEAVKLMMRGCGYECRWNEVDDARKKFKQNIFQKGKNRKLKKDDWFEDNCPSNVSWACVSQLKIKDFIGWEKDSKVPSPSWCRK